MKKRTFKHWTPRYIFNRINLFYFEKENPSVPWLTAKSIWIIDSLLKPNDKMIEFGSGRSTSWFAQRVKELISVETDRLWYEKVKVDVEKFKNTNLKFLNNDIEFRNLIATIDNSSIDISLIDGAYRELCANLLIYKMKLGGVMIIDNANWFFYNPNTFSPNSLKDHSEMSDDWNIFYKKTLSNRRIWTTNGITDTLIIFF
jgi:predicted O-methyltransferase YrrM